MAAANNHLDVLTFLRDEFNKKYPEEQLK